MTTKQASEFSGTEELPVTVHRKIISCGDRDLGPVESRTGRHVSGLYRAGHAIGALLDAGAR